MDLVFIADSFVNGTGDAACLGWVGRVCTWARTQGCEVTSYNLGVRRDSSNDIRTRWRDEIARRLPQRCDGRVVFSFGVNDTTWLKGKLRVAVPESVANARAILDAARRSSPVLMFGPPPVAHASQNRRIARLSREYASVCHELAVPYLDVFTRLEKAKAWVGDASAHEGSHPGARGYALFAQLVRRWPAWKAWFA